MVVELVVEQHIDFVQFVLVELEIESVVRNNFEGMNIKQVLVLVVEVVALSATGAVVAVGCACVVVLVVAELAVVVSATLLSAHAEPLVLRLSSVTVLFGWVDLSTTIVPLFSTTVFATAESLAVVWSACAT